MKGNMTLNLGKVKSANKTERSNPFDNSINKAFGAKPAAKAAAKTDKRLELPAEFVGSLASTKMRQLDLSKPFFNNSNPIIDTDNIA